MRIWRAMRRHALVDTLLGLGKNARICVLTEPMFTVPYALYISFASVYMSELGLSDPMIGLVSTLFLISQVLFSLLSGALADKLGRRNCTFIFDVLAWSVPALLWAFAQSAWWFVLAALLNGMMRITANSWELLLVEDEQDHVLVRLFALVYIAASLAAVGVLLSYPLVRRFGLVATMRGAYFFAFLSMSTKFVILYFGGQETRIGLRRMEETRGRSMLSLLKENGAILARMLRTPQVMWTMGLLACFTGIKNLADTFWPLLVIARLGIPEESLAVFSAARWGLMLICNFTIMPRVSAERFRRPVTLCFALQAVSKALVIFLPAGAALVWLWCSVALDAVSLALLNPLTESLQLLSLDANERARMLALFFAIMLLLTSPLGAIGGAMAAIDRALPLALAVALCALGAWFAHRIWALRREGAGAEAAGAR